MGSYSAIGLSIKQTFDLLYLLLPLNTLGPTKLNFSDFLCSCI